jgi:hypothetical protein
MVRTDDVGIRPRSASPASTVGASIRTAEQSLFNSFKAADFVWLTNSRLHDNNLANGTSSLLTLLTSQRVLVFIRKSPTISIYLLKYYFISSLSRSRSCCRSRALSLFPSLSLSLSRALSLSLSLSSPSYKHINGQHCARRRFFPVKGIFLSLPQTHHPKRDHNKITKAMALYFNFFIVIKITHHL